MSQVTDSSHAVPSQLRSHRTAVLAALLALVATGIVVLVVAIGDESPPTTGDSAAVQPAVRTNGTPNEAAVAAAVTARPSTGSSESRVAAAVGGSAVDPQRATGPDEGRTAAAVGATSSPSNGPDESSTAASISGR